MGLVNRQLDNELRVFLVLFDKQFRKVGEPDGFLDFVSFLHDPIIVHGLALGLDLGFGLVGFGLGGKH